MNRFPTHPQREGRPSATSPKLFVFISAANEFYFPLSIFNFLLLTSHLLPRTSYFAPPTSHLLLRTSYFALPTSHLLPRTSYLALPKVPASFFPAALFSEMGPFQLPYHKLPAPSLFHLFFETPFQSCIMIGHFLYRNKAFYPNR